MRAVVQRVSRASVSIAGPRSAPSDPGLAQAVDPARDIVVGAIDVGLMVLLGAEADDNQKDVDYLANKIVGLRVFEDAEGQMNLSMTDIAGAALLVVSQFTLLGDCRKGRRPSFIRALEPQAAEKLVDDFVARCRALGARVETGKFRAMMDVSLVNDGPVTLLLDSRKLF
jgi:D-tyrosyl-tRNA(Tyr) deacylase